MTIDRHLRNDPHWYALASLIDDIGEPCWAAYDTAAALQHFDGFALVPPFHLLVPRGRNIQRVGHHIHTSNSIPSIDREMAAGLPCTSPTRTLMLIAATVSPERLTVALAGALRDLQTTEDFLHRRLATLRASGRNGVIPMLTALERHEITRGGQSWLEREFLRIIEPFDFPAPRCQQILGRAGDRYVRVDFWFDGTPIVVEALGYRWHRTTAQMTIDAARYNQLVLDGYLPFQFTYPQIVTEPEFVVATLTDAFSRFGTSTSAARGLSSGQPFATAKADTRLSL